MNVVSLFSLNSRSFYRRVFQMNQRDVPSPFDAISEISRFRRNKDKRAQEPLMYDDLTEGENDESTSDDWARYLSQVEDDQERAIRRQNADSRLRQVVTLSATMMCVEPRVSTAWESLKGRALIANPQDRNADPSAVVIAVLGEVNAELDSAIRAACNVVWATNELLVLVGAHALFVPTAIAGSGLEDDTVLLGVDPSAMAANIVSGLRAVQPDFVLLGDHDAPPVQRFSGGESTRAMTPPHPVVLLNVLLHLANEAVSTHLVLALAPIAVQLQQANHHSVRVQRYDTASHDEDESYTLARFGERSRQGPWVDLGGLLAHDHTLSYLDAEECEPWDLFLTEARAPETLPVSGIVQLHRHGAPRSCVGIPLDTPESTALTVATAVAQRAFCDIDVLGLAFGDLIDQTSSFGYSSVSPNNAASIRTSFLCPAQQFQAVLDVLGQSGFIVTPEPLVLQTEMIKPSATVTWTGSSGQSGPIAIDLYKSLSLGPFSELITFDAFERHSMPLRIGGEWVLTLHPHHRFILHCLVAQQRFVDSATPDRHLFDSMIMTAPQSEVQLYLTSERAERWGVMSLMLEAVRSCMEHAGGLPPWLVDRATR